MNKIKLFFLLRKNVKLSNKRNVMFEANQYGKLFGYIMVAILSIEFIALGTFFGWLAAKEQAPEMVLFFMPFLLLLDFGARFATQQTPMMLVKPYLLTPISKYSAIECFLIQQLMDGGNFVWMTLFLPYTFIVWCGGISGWTAIGMLCLLHIMVLVNSQWYLLVRTLVNQKLWWWALPLAFYGSLIAPFFVLSDSQLDDLLDFIGDVASDYIFSWWTFGIFAVLFIILFAINRRMQMRLIYDEISKKEKTKLKHVSEFKALNRFGQIEPLRTDWRIPEVGDQEHHAQQGHPWPFHPGRLLHHLLLAGHLFPRHLQFRFRAQFLLSLLLCIFWFRQPYQGDVSRGQLYRPADGARREHPHAAARQILLLLWCTAAALPYHPYPRYHGQVLTDYGTRLSVHGDRSHLSPTLPNGRLQQTDATAQRKADG